jgi:cation transport regulator ChaB
MAEVRYRGKPPEQRLSDRMKNSGGDLPADVKTKHGEGPQRVYHNIHHSAAEHGTKRRDDNNGGDQ